MNPSHPVVNLEENETRDVSGSDPRSSRSNLVPQYEGDAESGPQSEEEIDPEVVYQVFPWPVDPVVSVVEIHLSDESPSNRDESASMEMDSNSDSLTQRAENTLSQVPALPHHDTDSSGSASMDLCNGSSEESENDTAQAPAPRHYDTDSSGSAPMDLCNGSSEESENNTPAPRHCDTDSSGSASMDLCNGSSEESENDTTQAPAPRHCDTDSSGSASMDLCNGSSEESENNTPAPRHCDTDSSGSAPMDLCNGSSEEAENGVEQAPAQLQNHVAYYTSSRSVSMDISSGWSVEYENGVGQAPAQIQDHVSSSGSVSMDISNGSSDEAANGIGQTPAQLQDHVNYSGSASMNIPNGSSQQTEITIRQAPNFPEVTDLHEQFPFQQGHPFVPAPLSIRRVNSSSLQARDTDSEQPPAQHSQGQAISQAAEVGILDAEAPTQNNRPRVNLPQSDDLHDLFPFQQGLRFVPRPPLIRRARSSSRRADVIVSAPSDPAPMDHSELTGQNRADFEGGSEAVETEQYDADDELSDATKSEVDGLEDELRQPQLTYMTGAYTSLYDYSTGSDGCDERKQDVQYEDSEQADLSCAREHSLDPETVVSDRPPSQVFEFVDPLCPEELFTDENDSFDDELRALDEMERERDLREAQEKLGKLAWYYGDELPHASPPEIRVIPPDTGPDYSHLSNLRLADFDPCLLRPPLEET